MTAAASVTTAPPPLANLDGQIVPLAEGNLNRTRS